MLLSIYRKDTGIRWAAYLLLAVASLWVLAALAGCVFVPVEYEETQITLSAGEVLQIEIDVDSSQVLEGSWKTPGDISGSYMGPNGDNRAWQSSSTRNDFLITGEINPGLYTFKFRNDGEQDTTLNFRYRYQ
jgi:hypothetical protein